MMPPYLEKLHELVERWSPLGVQEFEDGTRLIGRLPKKGSGAFLHRLFGPLSTDLIDSIEDSVGQSIPDKLREFFRYHNGCILFDQSIYVFGLRRSYDRSDFEAMACNPFDIVVPALVTLPKSPSGKGIAICNYEDGSSVLIEPDGEVVRLLDDPSGRVVSKWSNFGDWLVSEYQRIERFYDEAGQLLVDPMDVPPSHSIS